MQDKKCVIIIDSNLPLGVVANTAVILGVSLGKKAEHIVGSDFKDIAGHIHQGITQMAIPVLKSQDLNKLREHLKLHEPELFIVDLADHTQTQPTFEDYTEAFAATPIDEQVYLGLAVYGPKKLVNSYTGSLGLLR